MGGKAKLNFSFLLGRLRWTLLRKERYGESLSGRGSNTQPFNWEADTLQLSYRCPCWPWFLGFVIDPTSWLKISPLAKVARLIKKNVTWSSSIF